MRVLLIPELYRPDRATANGTLNDAVVWVDQWLAIDETLHVYWLLPPREVADYDREYVHADHERVTLIEARPFMSGHEHEYAFTESGYSEEQLHAIEEAIFDEYGYVDVVVDQLRRGRSDLYKWLLLQSGRRADEPAPFSLIVNVHDLLMPFKYRTSRHRNEFQRRMEIAGAVFADGIWFKAGVDARGMADYGEQFLRPPALDPPLNRAVMTQSPIDFSRFSERYSDRPRWLHVAGSIWEKKQTERVMEIAGLLHERYGIRTLLTSMSGIPDRYRTLPWVEAYPNASRETYERVLQQGDLTICASEYETLARTWFEQAASGQVLLLRDEPWIYDCVPADYGLVAEIDSLDDLAVWVVEHWSEAVTENRRMVGHVRRVRDPALAGRRTYDDLRRHVEEKTMAFPRPEGLAVVERTLAQLNADRISLAELDRQAASVTDDAVEEDAAVSYARGYARLEGSESGGRASERQRASTNSNQRSDGSGKFTDRPSISVPDLVFALRTLGYEDIGNPGTPVFRRGTVER